MSSVKRPESHRKEMERRAIDRAAREAGQLLQVGPTGALAPALFTLNKAAAATETGDANGAA